MRLQGIFVRSDHKFEVWCRNSDNVLECAGVANTKGGAHIIWEQFDFKDNSLYPLFYSQWDLDVCRQNKLKDDLKSKGKIIDPPVWELSLDIDKAIKAIINKYGMNAILEALICNVKMLNKTNEGYLTRLVDDLQITLNAYNDRY